ncbi:hypothetical protein MUO14_14190 [Halobacillus shinanisalinarum]|uniref:Uncharacterized protein n=1 Tax=Halobacillus shinanisalinarum TaxID=2932258 RepID=A0ABY4GUX1_9BACI|nr:hypothetical protein [Halobacillus shinanisalinarum]UOQ91695.1 hypothetical protein MUO14_14190 [Halobacillus shinanisalinarum]
MKNKKLMKWAGISSLLIIFAIATQWSMDDGTKPKLTHETSPAMANVDIPDNVKKAESKEEVMKFYESHTPGIAKAKSLEIATSPKQTYSIPEHEGKLYINNVWYTREVIFIYYSYDLSMLEASDSKEGSIKKLPVGIADVQMEALDGDIPTQSFGGHLNTVRPEHSIAYNGKLHTFTAIPPIRQKDAGNFQRRSGVPFDQTVLTSFHIEVNDDRYQTDASPINFTYDPKKVF